MAGLGKPDEDPHRRVEEALDEFVCEPEGQDLGQARRRREGQEQGAAGRRCVSGQRGVRVQALQGQGATGVRSHGCSGRGPRGRQRGRGRRRLRHSGQRSAGLGGGGQEALGRGGHRPHHEEPQDAGPQPAGDGGDPAPDGALPALADAHQAEDREAHRAGVSGAIPAGPEGLQLLGLSIERASRVRRSASGSRLVAVASPAS
mmetsp:Transcript_96516/g.268380  ORF Transcript_96516/g.268380 Transcript_96516/m.268380 type:complete len:203 (+) Transcript_96516:488-1096(+)